MKYKAISLKQPCVNLVTVGELNIYDIEVDERCL